MKTIGGKFTEKIINVIYRLEEKKLPIPDDTALPNNPDAPLPSDPRADCAAIVVAHLRLASLSHCEYP